MTTYTDHDTDYTDIKTYRCEQNPEQVRRDTLDCLDAGEDIKDIRACLTRSAWIENGYQMLHRLALRAQEKRERDAFFAQRDEVAE